MILPALIIVLLLGGFAAWIAGRGEPNTARWIAVITLTVATLLLAAQCLQFDAIDSLPAGMPPSWLADFNRPWIPRFGIDFHLALDGISLLLIALTLLLGFMAVSSSWTEIDNRQGYFFFNLLACLAGTVGVFLAVDLFLFFFFWELMIIPMYFLISIWGHENRLYAAIKFFIFTQVSGLLMLLAIIVLVLLNHRQTGVYSFDYFQLQNTRLDADVAFWLMLGFFIAFSVKLPAVPFHTWLPDAHTQASTGGSVILAGVMLKTGAYGLLRFVFPLFPEAAQQFAPLAMALGAASIVYAAMLAFAQTDLKRLIAYTSISHMGFIVLGLFSGSYYAMQGAVVTMLAHGISAAALFMIAGFLQQRLHTRELQRMGGLWSALPRLSALTLFFALASLGLPGLANFVGEFLVLLGAFDVNTVLTVVAALGLILAPIYALRVVQQTCHGALRIEAHLHDGSKRELASLGLLVLVTLWLGLHPGPVLNLADPALKLLQNYVVMEY